MIPGNGNETPEKRLEDQNGKFLPDRSDQKPDSVSSCHHIPTFGYRHRSGLADHPGRLGSTGKPYDLLADGFGRSETREALRDFFEVDARYIAVAAIAALTRAGKLQPADVAGAIKDLDIDPEKVNPMIS